MKYLVNITSDLQFYKFIVFRNNVNNYESSILTFSKYVSGSAGSKNSLIQNDVNKSSVRALEIL